MKSMALAARLPQVDLFLSAAGEEVLPIYKLRIEELRPRFAPGFRFRDKTASGVPVGMLYDDVYHTVVVAPATSNTVAKCAFGISDSLPTNMFAQAGKLGIPGIVFACDTEPVVVTKLAARLGDAAAAPHRAGQRRAAARHRLLPRGVLAGRTRSRARCAAGATVARMEHIVFLTGRLAQPSLRARAGRHRPPRRSPGRCARSACRSPR